MVDKGKRLSREKQDLEKKKALGNETKIKELQNKVTQLSSIIVNEKYSFEPDGS